MSHLSIVVAGLLASASTASATIPPDFHSVKITHAVIAPIVFALLMPIGAIMIRTMTFRGFLWYHATWMVFSYILSIVALGTGIYLAYNIHKLDSAHAKIGLIVICGCILQPVMGWLHHLLYKSVDRPNSATYPHVWRGRALITLGAINGGLGLQLANSTTEIHVSYSVGASVVWIAWMGVIFLACTRSRTKRESDAEEKISGMRSDGRPVEYLETSQTPPTLSDEELEITPISRESLDNDAK